MPIPTPFKSMIVQQVSTRWPDFREHAGSLGSAIFSYSTARFCSIRSEEVILYMAAKSILPICSMYTGRPSCFLISMFLWGMGALHIPCPSCGNIGGSTRRPVASPCNRSFAQDRPNQIPFAMPRSRRTFVLFSIYVL